MKLTRNTTAKSKIMNLLSHSSVALSHSELQTALEGICDRVTIYRVLKRLEKEGTVHKVPNIDGTMKFAICHNCSVEQHHHNHLHFNCEKCETVTCVEDVTPSFNLSDKYIVNEVNFMVSGICPQCT
tara:strand:+ start:308 stop:688 length:381 start_codon:yes stop_codon:yes gene_type:complete